METIKYKIYMMQGKNGISNAGTALVLDENKGTSKPLLGCQHIRDHSPTGFAWGYGGSGPAQLALAILVDAVGEEVALRLYHDFKFDVIAGRNGDWSIREDYVLGWVAGRLRRDLLSTRPGDLYMGERAGGES